MYGILNSIYYKKCTEKTPVPEKGKLTIVVGTVANSLPKRFFKLINIAKPINRLITAGKC